MRARSGLRCPPHSPTRGRRRRRRRRTRAAPGRRLVAALTALAIRLKAPRLIEDPHLWAVTLLDELRPLGFEGSYQSLTRQIRDRSLRPACQGGRYAPPRTPPGVNVTVLKTRYVHGYEHQEPKDWCHGEGFAT